MLVETGWRFLATASPTSQGARRREKKRIWRKSKATAKKKKNCMEELYYKTNMFQPGLWPSPGSSDICWLRWRPQAETHSPVLQVLLELWFPKSKQTGNKTPSVWSNVFGGENNNKTIHQLANLLYKYPPVYRPTSWFNFDIHHNWAHSLFLLYNNDLKMYEDA